MDYVVGLAKYPRNEQQDICDLQHEVSHAGYKLQNGPQRVSPMRRDGAGTHQKHRIKKVEQNDVQDIAVSRGELKCDQFCHNCSDHIPAGNVLVRQPCRRSVLVQQGLQRACSSSCAQASPRDSSAQADAEDSIFQTQLWIGSLCPPFLRGPHPSPSPFHQLFWEACKYSLDLQLEMISNLNL